MRLADLAGIGGDSRVTGFAIDHRKVAPGTVFGAFRGSALQRRGFHSRRRSAPARSRWSPGPEFAVEGAAHVAAEEPRREFARLAAQFFQPFPGDRGRGHRHQRQDLQRRADPAIVADGGASCRLDRDARRHHRRRPGDDRADHAGHRHLPVEHGRAGARGGHPRRLRGFEPRPRRNIAPKGCRCRPPPSPISAATISIITRRWRPISRPRCGCSTEVVEPGGAAVIWTDDPKSDEVARRCAARGLRLLTVGRRGETLKLVEREADPARPAPVVEAEGKAQQRRAAADRRLSGRQRADRGRPGARDRRRARPDPGEPRRGCSRCAGGSSGR